MGLPFYFALFIQFLCHTEAEVDAIDEAGLLVQVAEVTDEVNDRVLFLGSFIGQII